MAATFAGRVRSELDTLTAKERLEKDWQETLETDEWIKREHHSIANAHT
jgi:hypothetical protein